MRRQYRDQLCHPRHLSPLVDRVAERPPNRCRRNPILIPEGNWAGGGKIIYNRQVKGLVADDAP